MAGLIDPPTPLASRAEWEAFLAQMLKLPQPDSQVAWMIRMAREELADLDAEDNGS